MIIRSPKQYQAYTEAGKIATEILAQVKELVAPGVYSIELEEKAQKLCQNYQVEPSFAAAANQNGPYGYAMCISVNDTVLHGMPNHDTPFQVGDIVKLDFGIIYNGYHTDQCVTVGVKKLSKKNRRLMEANRQGVLDAVSLALAGNKTGDLGAAMQRGAKQKGYDVLKQYIGHGIGMTLHDHPAIPAYGRPNTGDTLKEGMVICVEAQYVSGHDQVYITEDSWTVKMTDGKNTAMFEYMVVVGKETPTILTPTMDWPLVTS